MLQRGEASRPPGSTVIIGGVVLVMTALGLARTWELPGRALFIKYWSAAGELLAGTFPAERLGDVSPGYLLVVSAWRAMGLSAVSSVRLQVALLGVAALLVGLAAARLAGRTAGVAAAVLVQGSRTALVNATDLEPETVLLLVLSLALWCAVRDEPSPRWLVAAGLVLGLSVAVRPTALVAVAGLTAGLVVAGWPRRAAWFGAAAGVPILLAAGGFFAITGTLSAMDGGAVFLEGNGPLATGHAGVQPAIVNDLEPLAGVPDGIHVSYRLVASRAIGRPVDRDESNRYWRDRAMAFIRAHPGEAVTRFARKALFVMHDYDSWDTLPMELNGRTLRWSVGFALLLGLGMLGAVWWGGRTRWPVILPGLALLASPVLMYVSGRQRNPLVPVLALLGGVAIARGLALARTTPRRLVGPGVALAAWLAVMMIDFHWMVEDRISWQALIRSRQLVTAASSTPPGPRRSELLAEAATWNSGSAIEVEPALVLDAARRVVTTFEDPPAWFDAALAMLRAGDPAGADAVLAELEGLGYRPLRGPRTVSSLAYHRAVAALARGTQADVDPLLARARREAPGDPDVLALSAVRAHGTDRAPVLLAELEAIHDPFTAELAMATALQLSGDADGSRARRDHLARVIPEWTRPAVVLGPPAGPLAR